MEYTGQPDDFGMHIEAVWKVAAQDFPDMANAYYLANKAIHQTHHTDDPASKSFRVWKDLRDEIQLIFARGASSLEDTADAIRAALQSYADCDAEAKAALQAAMQNNKVTHETVPDGIVPWSQRGPATNSPQDPPPPADAEYSTKAPSVHELVKKAQELEGKYHEALVAESLRVGGMVVHGPDARDTGVVAYIKDAAKVEPKIYQNAIAALKGVSDPEGGARFFGDFSNKIEDAKDALALSAWVGDAYWAFHENFLNRYVNIAAHQAQAVEELRGALEGLQNAREATHLKYMEILETTCGEFDKIIADRDAAETSLSTAALNAAVSLVAAFATGGTSLAIRFVLLASGISLTTEAAKVGGTDANTVFDKFVQAIKDIKKSLDEFDDQLSQALTDDLGLVNAARSNSNPDSPGFDDAKASIDLPRPNFISDPTLL